MSPLERHAICFSSNPMPPQQPPVCRGRNSRDLLNVCVHGFTFYDEIIRDNLTTTTSRFTTIAIIFCRLFCIHRNACNPCITVFICRNLFVTEIIFQNIIRDNDRFVFLKGDIFKPGFFNYAEILFFLNCAGNTTSIQFGYFFPFGRQFTFQYNIRNRKMSRRVSIHGKFR